MSPLGFDATKLYNFIGVRFKGTPSKVQEQALTWIQVKKKGNLNFCYSSESSQGELLDWMNENYTYSGRSRILSF